MEVEPDWLNLNPCWQFLLFFHRPRPPIASPLDSMPKAATGSSLTGAADQREAAAEEEEEEEEDDKREIVEKKTQTKRPGEALQPLALLATS